MSIQFGKWLETRRGRAWCGAIWGVLTAHLFWRLPLPGQTQLKRIATYKHNGKPSNNGTKKGHTVQWKH